MKNKLSIQAIAEGAMMAALTVILVLAGLYIPFLQFFVYFFWTIPGILIFVRHGFVAGILTLVVASIIVLMLSGPLSAVMAGVQIGALAVVYGYAIRKRWKAGKTVFSGMLATVAASLLLYYLFFWITGVNGLDITGQMQEAVDPTIEAYRRFGLVGENGIPEQELRAMVSGYIERVAFFFPAFFAMAGAFAAYLTHYIARRILRRFAIEVHVLPPFREWRMPWWIVWGLIAALGADLAGKYWGIDLLSRVGGNIAIFYVPFLFVLGLAVAYFLSTKYLSGKPFIRLMLPLFLFLFLPFSLYIVALLGVLDLFFDYRGIGPKK